MRLREWSTDQREKDLSEKRDVKLTVLRSDLAFDDIESDLAGKNLTVPFEIPPAFLDRRHASEIILLAGDTPPERWIRTLARVYLTGGRVLFRKINEEEFEAQITFS